MPKLDIVAVMTGSSRFSDPERQGRPRRATASRHWWTYLTAAVTADAAARSRSGGNGRARRAGEGGRHRTAGADRRLPAMAKTISGKTWRFAAGNRPADQVHHPQARRRRAVLRIRGRWRAGRRAGGTIRRADRLRRPLSRGRTPCATGRAPPGAPGPDDGTSLVLEVQTLGNDDAARLTHVFGDNTVELKFEMRGRLQNDADRAGPTTEAAYSAATAIACFRPGHGEAELVELGDHVLAGLLVGLDQRRAHRRPGRVARRSGRCSTSAPGS